MMAAANEGAAQGKGKSIGEVVHADQTFMASRKPTWSNFGDLTWPGPPSGGLVRDISYFREI